MDIVHKQVSLVRHVRSSESFQSYLYNKRRVPVSFRRTLTNYDLHTVNQAVMKILESQKSDGV
jgi:hypothetical protein